MTADRTLNFSLGLSIGLHAAMAVIYLSFAGPGTESNLTMVTDVDLIIPPAAQGAGKEARAMLNLEFTPASEQRMPAALPEAVVKRGRDSLHPKDFSGLKAFTPGKKTSAAAAPLGPEAGTAFKSASRGGMAGGGGVIAKAGLLNFSGGAGAGAGRVPSLHGGIHGVETRPLKDKKEALKSGLNSKRTQIAGPLSKRKILKARAPSFPAWAQEKGILEASVSIFFHVSKEGGVMNDMRLERSSGYAELDRLALEALKNWLFAPAEAEREWGIITFKFILE